MDKIFISDLVVKGIIGVNASERKKPQRILVNVVLTIDLHQAGESDGLQFSVDYSELAEKIKTCAESACRFTVEALAEDLAAVCLEYARVEEVHIRVEKPGALRASRSVGVEMDRVKQKHFPGNLHGK